MVVGADSLPGRSRQLAQLEFLAESVWNDGVAFYVLEADAGLGKTRLVETALDTMGAKGVRTVRAPAAYEQEPYRTAIALLEGTIGSSRELFEMRHDGGQPVDRTRSDRVAMFSELAAKLIASCEQIPTVIALDDAQWVDAASVALLEIVVDEVLTAQPLTPVLWIVSHRPLPETAPIFDLLSRIRGARRAVTDVLEPLGGADLFEAIERLGVPRPSATFQSVVERASFGNPLRLRAAVETMRRRNIPADLHADDQRARGTLDLRTAPDDPLRRWVDDLDPAAQRVLGGAGILGNEFTAVEATAATEATAAEVERALDAGHALRLIESDGNLCWFTHALIRDELIDRLAVSERGRVHQRCVALERSRAATDPTAWARAAEHVLASVGWTSVGEADADVLEAASEWASRSGAWTAAARYGEAAIEAARTIGLGHQRMAALSLRAAEAHHVNFDLRAAQQRLTEVLTGGSDGLDEISRSTAVRLSTQIANYQSAQMGTGAVDLRPLTRFVAEARDPHERAQALRLLAEIEIGQAKLDDAMDHASEAVRVLEGGPDRRALGLAYHAVGFAHLTAVEMVAAETAYRRMYEVASAAEDRWLTSEALARLQYIPLVVGDLDEAERRTAATAGVARKDRQYVSESLAEGVQALVTVLRGDLRATERHAQRARSTMHRCGYLTALQFFNPALLRARLLEGDLAGAERVLREWTTDGGQAAPPARRYLDLVSGDGGKQRSRSSRPSGRLTQFAIGLAAVQAEAAIRRGDSAGIEPVLTTLEAAVAKGVVFPMNWPACLHRLLGDGYNLLGDSAAAAAQYRRAIAICDGARAHAESIPALLALALMDNATVGDEEKRRAGADAYRLAGQLGFNDAATAAALAVHGTIDLSPAPSDIDYRVILVSDIVGSTTLSVGLGDRAYHSAVTLHHRLVRAALAQHRGVEFSEGGDSLFASFTGASDAASCALSILARLDVARRSGAAAPHVRVALAAGTPFVQEGRPYGAVVNLAARIAPLAEPDQVIVTASIAGVHAGSVRFRPLGPAALKGFPGLHKLFVLQPGQT